MRDRRSRAGYAVAALVLALVACSGDDTADSTAVPDTSSSTAAPAGTTSSPPTTTAAPVAPHELDLTSEEICDLVAADAVAAVLDVTLTGVFAIEDASPQCSYQFDSEALGVNNVVVNVPSISVDTGGRTGAEAYEHIVGLTRIPDSTEAPIDAGDGGIMFSSPPDAEAGVQVSVFLVGDRVVTTIATLGVFDVATVNALNELAAEALAP